MKENGMFTILATKMQQFRLINQFAGGINGFGNSDTKITFAKI